jgi:hypothetical protein
MRAATTESTRERKIRIMASVLVISVCFLVSKAAAQSDKPSLIASYRSFPPIRPRGAIGRATVLTAGAVSLQFPDSLPDVIPSL